MLIYTEAFPYNEFWQVVQNTNNIWAGVRRYVYCIVHIMIFLSLSSYTFMFVTWNCLNAINLSFKWFYCICLSLLFNPQQKTESSGKSTTGLNTHTHRLAGKLGYGSGEDGQCVCVCAFAYFGEHSLSVFMCTCQRQNVSVCECGCKSVWEGAIC